MLLEQLSNARGASGDEGPVRELLIEAIKDRVDDYRVDSLGNLIACKRARGARRQAPLRVMIAAHMDEVALMIVHHESNGQLRFRKVGGIDDRVLLAKVVLIGENQVPGVIGSKPIHLLKPKEREQVVDVESMYIDIGAKTKDEAQSLVKIGDYATFATEFGEMGDKVVRGKAFDDRAGCAALADILKKDYPFDLYAVFTTQEEVGSRGARVAAYAIDPQVAFVLEATVCDDSPRKKDESPRTRLGQGVAITIADASAFSDRRLINLLVETAKENRIPFQFKESLRGGTDAGRIALAREGVPSAVLSIPTRYIHSPVALLSLHDYDSLVSLMVKTMPKLGQGIPELV